MAQKTGGRKAAKQRLEKEQALAYRQEQTAKRRKVIRTVIAVVVSVLLVFAFCFPAVTMLMA